MWLIPLLIIVDLYILSQTGKRNINVIVSAPKYNNEEKWTVYGTMGCGWTRKQIDYMKSKNIPHEFVDCSKGKCDKDIQAYPTLMSPAGEKTTGFKEV